MKTTSVLAGPRKITANCDHCRTEARHDYTVPLDATKEQGYDIARSHLSRNESWSCTPAGDFCPNCVPEETSMATPTRNAANVAQAVGDFNHSTVPSRLTLGWEVPSQAYDATRSLAVAAERLPEAIDQILSLIEQLENENRLATSGRKKLPAQLDALKAGAAKAKEGADTMGQGLGDMRDALRPLSRTDDKDGDLS